MKTCRTCRETKPLDDFYSRGRTRNARFLDCKACVLDARRERYKISPQMQERLKRQAASWRRENPARVSELKRRRWVGRYGLTEDDYLALLEGQGGRCAICRRDTPLSQWTTFHIDHDHKTGFVRGLLCHRCNVGLGHFLDDPALLHAAIRYLAQADAERTA